ncbi:hypothetical protein BH20CHL7_BH20CHL7_12970 [soil metagenome]
MRTPGWDEVLEFLKHDGWEHDAPRSTDHDHFERALPDGEVLITRVSRSGKKTLSPGRFNAILSDQLRVSAAQFWNVIRLKEPAERPSPEPAPAPNSLPLWLVQQLEPAGVTGETIQGLAEDEGQALLNEVRSRPARG